MDKFLVILSKSFNNGEYIIPKIVMEKYDLKSDDLMVMENIDENTICCHFYSPKSKSS